MKKGSKHTEETKAKMSAAQMGHPGIKHTAEARAKMSTANLDRPLSLEHRAKISAARTGKKASPETRAKLVAARKRRGHVSAETRAKMSAAHKGKVMPPETRAKISAAHSTPEARERSRRAHLGVPLSVDHHRNLTLANQQSRTPAVRKKISQSLTGRKHTPEACANMSAAQKGRIFTEAHRQAMCDAWKRRLSSPDGPRLGRLYSRGISSWFHSVRLGRRIWCRSTYERAVVEQLDTSPIIQSFQSEPYAVPYEFEGRARSYIPDLEVEFVGGEKQLIEIKPKVLKQEPQNLVKFRAADRYAREHGMRFVVWDERAIF